MSDDSYGSRSPDSEPEPDRAFIRIDPENVFYLARLSASPLPPEFPSDVHAALILWLQDAQGDMHQTLPILLRRSQVREAVRGSPSRLGGAVMSHFSTIVLCSFPQEGSPRGGVAEYHERRPEALRLDVRDALDADLSAALLT